MENNEKKTIQPRRGGSGPMGGPMGGMGSGEKAKDFKTSFKRLIRYLRPESYLLLFIVILSAISTAFAILGPKWLGNITNELQRGIKTGSLDMNYIIKTAILVGSLYLISAILGMVSNFAAAGVSQKVVYRMRRDIKEKLTRIPVKYFDENSTGNILSRVTNDVDTIYNTLQQSLTQSISGVVSIVGILIMMFTISGYMTLVTLGSIPLYLIVTMLIAKKSQKKFFEQQKKLGELNGYIEEMFTGQKTVALYGREDKAVKGFTAINEKLYESGKGAQFLSGMIMPLLRLVESLSYVGVCVVGAVLAGRPNPIGIGDIQAFIQYSSQFTQPVMQTANIANTIQSTIAASERVFTLLDVPEEKADPIEAASTAEIAANVAFDNVDFSYDKEKELIKDMNVAVKEGHRIAIVGPTGAGKTTMVNLLLRFYEIDGGRILIGGEDIQNFKKKDLRSLFGMVLQDTWLFSGTIKENIAYGRPDATDEEIMSAAKAAHVDHFIATLSDGFNTVLNEEVSNISQGEKQLLTIARAILADPKILILDEATSSVDTRTEAYIQNAMTAMMKEKTSFIIAHRLSTIKNADLILVMNKGSIVEQGSHQELLAKKGFYYELYNSQFAPSV